MTLSTNSLQNRYKKVNIFITIDLKLLSLLVQLHSIYSYISTLLCFDLKGLETKICTSHRNSESVDFSPLTS